LKETFTKENLLHLSILVACPVCTDHAKVPNVFVVTAYFIMHLSTLRTSVFILSM